MTSIVPRALGLLFVALASAAFAVPPKLGVDEIVARNVAARGGLEAWRKLDTLTLAGELDAGGKASLELPFVMKLKRPNKTRLELRFMDQTALQVYDGTQGWKLRPFLGRHDVEPYTADEARAAAGWAGLDGLLIDHAAKGTTVALEGSDVVEGHDAYRLKLGLKNGSMRHLWVDAKSFLELKVDGDPRKLDGRLHAVSVFYRDYRAEHGLVLAHGFETVVDGVKPSRKMTVQSVNLNPALADAEFAKPDWAPAAKLAAAQPAAVQAGR